MEGRAAVLCRHGVERGRETLSAKTAWQVNSFVHSENNERTSELDPGKASRK
jgi:hypothetical protein